MEIHCFLHFACCLYMIMLHITRLGILLHASSCIYCMWVCVWMCVLREVERDRMYCTVSVFAHHTQDKCLSLHVFSYTTWLFAQLDSTTYFTEFLLCNGQTATRWTGVIWLGFNEHKYFSLKTVCMAQSFLRWIYCTSDNRWDVRQMSLFWMSLRDY